ncbi:TVP38/TMEM64 family protein [Bacillus sp. FJAT-45350]|uniref:TVP38/TMEM64 family protein n=1 Tax=Bacillus sp. FJAT-45350 TaxID=2011014 RepID=UPI000BB6931F|nr:VTT domain-containing protein [Bacillus sp. FJAT-45350]
MEHVVEGMVPVIENSGWLAPLLFIFLHVFRQVFFIPVVIICLLGGYLFGIVYGTIYSIIGLTAVSIVFYYIVKAFPSWLEKLSKMKNKWLGEREQLNLAQIMILRLMPLIHFHLVSLYLIETTKDFREYCKYSFYACIPPALAYTAFGHIISELPLQVGLAFVCMLAALFYFVGKKETQYKWNEFFETKST